MPTLSGKFSAVSEPLHQFHIPVMGTAFTIDSPLKVARFGISSVMSIVDDELCEYTRQHYATIYNEPFEPIHKTDEDCRARRITAFLNLMNTLVNRQMSVMRQLPFEPGNELTTYFDLLPETSPVKQDYLQMLTVDDGPEKLALQENLRQRMRPGDLEVNIMTKLDRNTYTRDGELLPEKFSDALSAFRGFAQSELASSIVFSAGFNRRLYAYIEQFEDFFPDETGFIKKKIILKVSDYRSSLTQGRFLAKKGLWVSEHRIESGLNCGGHVFPSDGDLLGPILEEFKLHRNDLVTDLFTVASDALQAKGKRGYPQVPHTRITVQGGIGTVKEQQFLLDYYQVDGTGWGTPFLLVEQATTLDPETRELLKNARPEDLYTSEISPLGVRFNTVKGTPSEIQKLDRVMAGKPGSPCPKGYLVSNTEFTDRPICTASTLFQRKKLKELEEKGLTDVQAYQEAYQKVIAKTCLCEDLAASALYTFNQSNRRPLKSAVCPGPNLAYFSRLASLAEMVGHIYGRINLLNDLYRPNMFIAELKMYIDHLSREIRALFPHATPKQLQYVETFRANLESGIDYYKTLIPKLHLETESYRQKMSQELSELHHRLMALVFPTVVVTAV